jgi:TolB protein
METRSLFLALLLAAPCAAETDVHIKLAGQGAAASRVQLVLPPFAAEDVKRPEDSLAAKQLRDVARADLMYSRYFEVVEDGPPLESMAKPEALSAYWKPRGANWILAVTAGQSADKLSLSAQLIDVQSGRAVFDRTYKQDARFSRSLAHRLSDDVVQAVTGRSGVAHTQIAFANDESGHKEIYVVDYDGANLRRLTKDGSIDILPRFSPDRKKLAYTSFKDGNPDLFELDLDAPKPRSLSSEQGLNIAGGFSPDGSQLLMTLSRGRSPNLYVKSLSDGALSQLTQHFGADSSPTFSPDAGQVAFVSDRAGNPQIYVLDMTTRRAKRLTNLNWCDSPSWSPTGEWIAFAGRANTRDKMDIFLVDITGNQIRQLTHGEGSSENPSWSPDGRFIVFSRRGPKGSQLFVMDSDGSAPHPLADLAGSSSTPSWSN